MGRSTISKYPYALLNSRPFIIESDPHFSAARLWDRAFDDFKISMRLADLRDFHVRHGSGLGEWRFQMNFTAEFCWPKSTGRAIDDCRGIRDATKAISIRSAGKPRDR